MDVTHREVARDCGVVTGAATALGVTEFDFFRFAYRRWFGREAEEKALERTFAAYMFHETVPPWARHAAREVLRREREGTLDTAARDAAPYRKTLTPHPAGKVIVALAAAVWCVLYAALLSTTYDPGTSAPITCASESGSRFYDVWVNLIAGREPPPCVRAQSAAGSRS